MADIEGVNKTKWTLADGSVVYYYYAWRGKGAPRFWTSPHKPVKKPYPREFVRAFDLAIEKKIRDDNFDGMAARYLKELEASDHPATTKSEYMRLVERARREFGPAPLSDIVDPRFRADIIDFRDKFRSQPRAADLAVLGVSLVLESARNRGLLANNPAASIPNLYTRPNDKRPWTAAQIQLFTQGDGAGIGPAEPHVLDAFWLIKHFACRRRDAIALRRPVDRDTHLTYKTSKGKRKNREVVFPVLPEARAFLDDLYRRNAATLARLIEKASKEGKDPASLQEAAAYLLITSRGERWTAERSVTHAFETRWMELLDPKGELRQERKALAAELKADTKPGANRLKVITHRLDELEAALDYPTPHRLRNNAATALMKAKIDDRTIADAMGWSKEDVEEMRRVYVDREELVSAAIIQLREHMKGSA